MAFAPHGKREIWTEGRILMSRNRGPFNVELLKMSTEQTRAERIRLTESGPWGSIAVISESVLFTPEALEMVRRNMSDPVRNGNLVASAFVLSDDTVGKSLAEAIFRPVYGLAGAEFRVFDTLEPAREWVESLIEEASRREKSGSDDAGPEAVASEPAPNGPESERRQ
ncbi:MAG: hypothetical protein JJ959_05865 [Nisaea sp.]|uniref:hypothetical protein n=1 Tax=Nisaea sp. TaxID=2024842 RepID=UPI001B0F9DA7|nr:hypothetical protein [Nisaea sp.]MBO6560041.1 hypothetical protein [Nisaea sp.]